MVEGSVGLLLDAQRSRSAYLKALDWAGGGPTDEYEQFRSQLLSEIVQQRTLFGRDRGVP